MKDLNKRWLISQMKTSGSKRVRIINPSYSETRQKYNNTDFEDIPSFESFSKQPQFYNGKINYDLLVRFLNGQINKNWDEVYSEILQRIPTKLMDYKEMIFWFVPDKVEIDGAKILNLKSQKYIYIENSDANSENLHQFDFFKFYVNPIDNNLIKIKQKSFKRLRK